MWTFAFCNLITDEDGMHFDLECLFIQSTNDRGLDAFQHRLQRMETPKITDNADNWEYECREQVFLNLLNADNIDYRDKFR